MGDVQETAFGSEMGDVQEPAFVQQETQTPVFATQTPVFARARSRPLRCTLQIPSLGSCRQKMSAHTCVPLRQLVQHLQFYTVRHKILAEE